MRPYRSDGFLGYLGTGNIPLSEADPHFQMERAREVAVGFPTCKCSNCKPEAANDILNIVQQMSNEKFDQMLSAPLTIPKDDSIVTIVRKRKSQKQKSTCHLNGSASMNLANFLVHTTRKSASTATS
jgi:hypothetical protein